MNGLGELVQAIGLAVAAVAVLAGLVWAARLIRAVVEVRGLDVSASYERDEDGR